MVRYGVMILVPIRQTAYIQEIKIFVKVNDNILLGTQIHYCLSRCGTQQE